MVWNDVRDHYIMCNIVKSILCANSLRLHNRADIICRIYFQAKKCVK